MVSIHFLIYTLTNFQFLTFSVFSSIDTVYIKKWKRPKLRKTLVNSACQRAYKQSKKSYRSINLPIFSPTPKVNLCKFNYELRKFIFWCFIDECTSVDNSKFKLNLARFYNKSKGIKSKKFNSNHISESLRTYLVCVILYKNTRLLLAEKLE